MSSATTTLSPADLECLVASALGRVGASPPNAMSVARALVAAEMDDQKGHGLSRVTSYAAQVASGKIDGRAVPVPNQTRSGTLVVDAAHGFAYPALDLAIDRLPALAHTAGIAAAGIFRSHHAGALGLVAERLAAHGLVALVVANTPSAMAAWGGRRPHLGTNPIAFAAPRADGPPIVVDLALSEVARGKIVAAAQKGEPIPLGWATDIRGEPTTDPKAALQGTLLPAGGAKGAALALMVEVMAAAVTGAHFASEATSFLDDKGAPPATGQLLIAIAPSSLGANTSFAARMSTLAQLIEAEQGVRLPGSQKPARRELARTTGLAVDPHQIAVIEAIGTHA